MLRFNRGQEKKEDSVIKLSQRYFKIGVREGSFPDRECLKILTFYDASICWYLRFFCVPGMGDNLVVKVHYRLGSRNC